MSSESITGSTIAGYHVTGYLRPGRMGDNYVARRTSDNQLVSIKLLDPQLASQDEAVQRFHNECRVTSQLQHPCSLTVLDHGTSERGPYLVTEYVVGDTLADAIEESGAMPTSRAAWIAAQIAMALEAAHGLGVVHRDLSPSNVLLTELDGSHDVVKVLEFGLSRATEEDTSADGLTAVGVRIGTPYYMAPEYIEEYTLDERADLYALGIVLYEMLTGEPPFTGRPYKVMDHHLNKPMPVPSEHAEGVPPWMDELVAALTHKAPAERIQTAAEVVARISAGLGRPLAPVQPSAPVEPEPAPAPDAQPRIPEVDPVLAHFVKECVGNILQRPGPRLEPRECLLVTRVAEHSLAHELRVRPGYLMNLPDEHYAVWPEQVLTTPIVDDRRYHFASADGLHTMELRTNGIPLGIDVIRTSEHLWAAWDPTKGDPMPLLDLWELREWDQLERMAHRALTQQSGAAAMLNTGLFAKFLGRTEYQVRDHPALLMHGAARIEKGDQGGMEEVKEYAHTHAHKWQAPFAAIANFYLAMDRARRGADAEALELLQRALGCHPLARADQAIEKMTGNAPSSRSWVGRRFPDYNLETFDQSRQVNLRATLQHMDASQVLLVCMLGGTRGSLEYNAFMERYLSYVAWFPDFITDLHVLSTVDVRDGARPEHYKAEDIVLDAGVPLALLEDYRGLILRRLETRSFPTVYVVGKHGIVVHEGLLSPAEWWEALAENGRVRLETYSRSRT